MFDRGEFYYWLQKELERELSKVYKKIHRTGIFGNSFYIWFLNNEDSVGIPLNVMEDIYNNGKSIKELTAVIDAKYVARIKKCAEDKSNGKRQTSSRV